MQGALAEMCFNQLQRMQHGLHSCGVCNATCAAAVFVMFVCSATVVIVHCIKFSVKIKEKIRQQCFQEFA
jgi:hypothetical protein